MASKKKLVLRGIGDVDATIVEMDRLRQRKKELEEQMDYYKTAIKDYLTNNQMTAFETSSSKVSWTKTKRRVFDKERLRVERPRMYEQYMTDMEYEQLYFKVR